VKLLLQNLRIVDESTDMTGSVLVEEGTVTEVIPAGTHHSYISGGAAVTIDGGMFALGHTPVLMPAFVDLHAHFRDPGYPEKETLESASLAAAAGGYGTVVCMANTNPVIDTFNAALSLKKRSDALGLIDLYPAMSLTQGMAGKILSDITYLSPPGTEFPVRMLSEDGKDLTDDALLRAAFSEAYRLGIPVSCHCDAGGLDAQTAKQAGAPREVWSRLEENHATQRAIALGKEARCHVHIAHVSTREAVELIRQAKAEISVDRDSAGNDKDAFTLTCEATPHHLGLTQENANLLGAESWGRVNPPLRTEADRQALMAAILDGTIDAIATDHAPHTEADKAGGAPGFTGLETGFGVCRTELVREDRLGLSRLSALMSAVPARILGLRDRGRIAPGFRADLALVDTEAVWQAAPESFKSRGKNSPFTGRCLTGKVLMTMYRGQIVFGCQLPPCLKAGA
jgi:dihydroorotase